MVERRDGPSWHDDDDDDASSKRGFSRSFFPDIIIWYWLHLDLLGLRRCRLSSTIWYDIQVHSPVFTQKKSFRSVYKRCSFHWLHFWLCKPSQYHSWISLSVNVQHTVYEVPQWSRCIDQSAAEFVPCVHSTLQSPFYRSGNTASVI